MLRFFFFLPLKYVTPILVLELRLIMSLCGSWFKCPNHQHMFQVVRLGADTKISKLRSYFISASQKFNVTILN